MDEVNKGKKIHHYSLFRKLKQNPHSSIWLIKHKKKKDLAFILQAIDKSQIFNVTDIKKILNQKKCLEKLSQSQWISQYYSSLQDEGHLYFIQTF